MAGILARQFGIEARGVGNVGDQPVEPAHVVLDDLHQPRLRELSLLASGSVSTALRSEVSGFFSSCADVGGKALDRLDARIERVGHVAQRDRQIADLVLAVGEIRDLLAALDAAAHPHGGRRQPAQRVGDGRGEQHRQDRRDQRGDAEDAQDRLALGADDLVDVAALRRQHQHAEHGAEALDRHRDRNDLLALLADRARPSPGLPVSAFITSG